MTEASESDKRALFSFVSGMALAALVHWVSAPCDIAVALESATQRKAIRAGVGRYTVDPKTGKSGFEFFRSGCDE